MPRIERLQPRQLLGLLLDLVGQAQEDPPPLARTEPTPTRESPLRRTYRSVDVPLSGHRHVHDRGIVVRIDRGQRPTLVRIHKLTAYE